MQWHTAAEAAAIFSGRQNDLSKAGTRVSQATFQMIN